MSRCLASLSPHANAALAASPRGCDTAATGDNSKQRIERGWRDGADATASQCLPGKDECPCKKNSDCKDDGDLCNGVPYCDKSDLPWACKTNPGTVVSCSAAGDTACLANQCAASSGKCAMQPVNSGGGCSDGDPCTGGDSCDKGQCQAGVNLCGCQSDQDCAKLDDGNLCNGALYCNKAVATHICQGNPATVVVCPSADDTACAANQCNPGSGKCAIVLAKDGSPCSDDNPCTVDDGCASGKCAAKTNTCPCSQTTDCSSKDDGNLCNGSLFCDKGKLPCVCNVNPATVVVCPSAQDGPCSKNTCAAATGKCAMADVNQGVPCDADGNACTQGDVCEAGTCEPGLNNCPCQADGDCLAQDDGNPCNGKLYCDKAAKKCLVNPNTVVACNAAQDSTCAANQCDPANGLCKMTPRHQGQACDADGNGCTVGDSCDGGNCAAGPNTCGCQSDAACAAFEDGNLLNSNLFCDKTALPFQCKINPGTIITCPTVDDAACLKRVCQPLTGQCPLQPVGQGASCDDGNACTADACMASAGITIPLARLPRWSTGFFRCRMTASW